MTYEEALAAIHAVHWQGHKPGLERTRALLAALGSPEKELRFVHVAGTNGKGSTAAMLDSCLRCAGYRVGLFTSPYINRFNERIQVDGVPIPDEALVRLVERVGPVAAALDDTPTEFEFITALGMLWFAASGCDIVVLEVGLGGALDSTNVIPPPACAVITALGLDHVKELGPTLADIAAAKAGIIKPGSPAVSYGGAPEADRVIAARAAAVGAPLTVADFGRLHLGEAGLEGQTFDFDGLDGLRLPLLGRYQPRNAAVAITALRVLRASGWDIPDEAIRQMQIPCSLLIQMKRKSEDRFQTAVQAADAMSMIGRADDAVDLIISTASENPTPEHTTQALISALRYSLLKGDISAASDYAVKARKAVEGLGNGIGKGIYDKELRIFESFLSGEETMLSHRYHTAETELIKLEAAMLLSGSNDIALKDECVRFISEPREDKL